MANPASSQKTRKEQPQCPAFAYIIVTLGSLMVCNTTSSPHGRRSSGAQVILPGYTHIDKLDSGLSSIHGMDINIHPLSTRNQRLSS
jgi:hypothetical protein